MKVLEKNRLSVSGELKDSVFFGIKQGGFAHIFNVLRNQLYSDKILAVVREYSANAYDAHIANGNGDTPFEVTLPNRMDMFFKIRDFGDGLTQEEVRDIYANYGESTKRQSNDYIGQLGLGSKSAFSYSDSFTITSYSNGTKYVYSAYIDESDLGKIVLLENTPTKEADGIEISVPVQDQYDVDSFKEKAEQVYKYYDVKPVIKGQTLDFKTQGRIILEGDDWKIRADETGSAVAVMGNIGYKIDTDACGIPYRGDDKLYEVCRTSGLEVHFDIGDLEMAASREGLQYTTHTKRNIIKKLKTLKKDIIKKVQERFKGCTTNFQAKCLYNDLFDMTHDLYHIREIVAKDLIFKNKKIDNSTYYVPDDEGSVYTIAKTYRSEKYKAETVNRIDARTDAVIIKNDIGNNRALLGRLLPMMIEENKKPYVYSFKDSKKEAEYIKRESFDPEDVVLLSSLPRHKMSELAEKYGDSEFVNKRYIPRLLAGGKSNYAVSSKHTAKIFKIDWDAVKGGWNRNASEYWEEVEVDLEKDEGVYVMIDRFKISDDNHYNNGRANCFGNFQSCFEDIGLDMPDVYGFKIAMTDKVKEAKNFRPFFGWAKEQLEEAIADNGIQQIWSDFNVYQEETTGWDYPPLYNMDKKSILRLKNKVNDKGNSLMNFLEKVGETQRNEELLNSYLKLMKALNLETDEYKKKMKAGGYKFGGHLKKINSTYPLIQFIEKNTIRRCGEKEFVNELAHYVNLIDGMSVSGE